MKVLCALIVACCILTGAASAKTDHSQTITAKRQFYHADGFIKAIGKNARRTIYHSNPRIRHKWKAALAYLIRVRHHSYLVLHPPPPPRQVLGHLAMWLCIHSKEGAWNSDTGNGYLGGLQMTPGWGGVSRPDLLSPGAQIALAERGYAASGYSISWLRGQWPSTSYGCV